MKKLTAIPHTIILLLCFSATSLFSQKVIDKDSLSTYTFDELSDKFYAAKPDSLKAVMYAHYIINKATQEKDTLQTADGHYYLSDITKNPIYFIDYWKGIIEKTNNKKNKLYPVVSHIQLGEHFRIKGMQKKALDHFLKAKEKLKQNKNDSLEIVILHRLAHIKSQNNQLKEAVNLYRKVFFYYKYKKNKSKTSNNYYSVLVNLSSSYSRLKLHDSAIYYNELLRKLALKNNDGLIIGYSINTSGKIKYRQKEYQIAIDRLRKSIPYIINDENYGTLSNTYLLLAKSYKETNKIKKSLKYYLLVDSLFSETKSYFKSQKTSYANLYKYYKSTGDNTKQLEYINKYVTVDSVLNTRIKGVNKSLNDNYDIPNLLAEKELIEKELKQEISSSNNWIIGITSVTVVLVLFLVQQARKRKLYKKRFQQLIAASSQIDKAKKKKHTKKEQTISQVVLGSISNQLDLFEKNQEFLSTEVTLSSLAKIFETNSKYLSQVINQQKEQSFNNYINSLRIHYTVEKLKTDLVFRKYSIKAIANEVGFNTTESFSKAFFKNTGIKPSFFIKELDN